MSFTLLVHEKQRKTLMTHLIEDSSITSKVISVEEFKEFYVIEISFNPRTS